MGYASFLKGKLKKVDHMQKRYPTSSVDVARVVVAMAEKHRCAISSLEEESGDERLHGIYHWQNTECLTKYEMLRTIADIVGIDVSGIDPDMVIPEAPRPEHSRLTCAKLEEALGGDPGRFRTKFRESLRESLMPFMVQATFAKNLTADSTRIQKEDLLALFELLAPDRFSRHTLEASFTMATESQVDNTVDYEHFIK